MIIMLHVAAARPSSAFFLVQHGAAKPVEKCKIVGPLWSKGSQIHDVVHIKRTTKPKKSLLFPPKRTRRKFDLLICLCLADFCASNTATHIISN